MYLAKCSLKFFTFQHFRRNSLFYNRSIQQYNMVGILSDKIKIIEWDFNGFWLLYKRLEQGSFAAVERGELTPRDLVLLLEGIDVVRERVRYTPRAG